MATSRQPLHVSLVATPDAQVSPLSGLFETLNSFGLLANFEPGIPTRPFDVEVVAAETDVARGASERVSTRRPPSLRRGGTDRYRHRPAYDGRRR
jgi:hypothetical protein